MTSTPMLTDRAPATNKRPGFRRLGLLTIAAGAFSVLGCTQPEAPKAPPPPGMAGAPTTLGNHGSAPAIPVAPSSQPHANRGLPGSVASGTAPGHGAASQPAAMPKFPTIVPGSGAPASQQPQEPTHGGVVVEAMDAADYTYMKIKKDDGKEEWAATTRTQVKVGDRVVVSESLVMHDFQSKSLNRTFKRIIFGTRK